MPVEAEVPQQVQQHGDDHAVGGIAVQAAHDPAHIPVLPRQMLDRVVGLGYAGVEEDVQVQPARSDDPEQEEGDLAQVIERIEPVAEDPVEQASTARKAHWPARWTSFSIVRIVRAPPRCARGATRGGGKRSPATDGGMTPKPGETGR